MSALSKQLQTIKHNQRVLKVTPNQQQPTLLLDSHVATTTSADLIYTLAVLGYAKLLKQQPFIKEEGESLMGMESREINRNLLTKEGNRGLSENLVRFMLKISPFFMSEDCQKVLQYLLHNYKINIFEAQPMAIIYLQYWNTSLYHKLISNVPQKILSVKLPFLAKLNPQQQHNITYIIKSLSYSHFLLSSLLLYTLEYIKYEGKETISMDIEINLGEEYQERPQELLRADPRRFLLQVFMEFIDRRIAGCYKYILQFCGKAIFPNRLASAETCSMVMLLATRLFIEGSLSDELLQLIISRLLKKNKEVAVCKGFFDFILIVWQRRASCIKKEAIDFLEGSKQFHKYLGEFKCSLWMILIDLVGRWALGEQSRNLITLIGIRIKKDEFYLLYGQQYLSRLFSEVQRCVEFSANSNFIVQFLKLNYQHEVATFYNKKVISNAVVKEAISMMLPKASCKFSKNGELLCNISSIPKATCVPKVIQKQPEFAQQEESSQQEQPEQIKIKQKSSLVSLLNKKGLNILQINYKDAETKQQVLELVRLYYLHKGKQVISQEQKNQIMEHYLESYSFDQLIHDLQQSDFVLPIKYLSMYHHLEASKHALNLLTTRVQLIDEVLYRQLMRISLNQISASFSNNYKQTVYYLNTFFKKMISKQFSSAQPIELLKLSDILLKFSEQTFGKEGTKKGKYQKILHNHGKMIAELIVGIKLKKQVTKELNDDERLVLEHYLRVLRVFGVENLYLLNIGIVEMLTKKELDHGHLRYFITKILLGGIRLSGIDFYQFGLSLAKTIVFCSQLDSVINIKREELDPSISSGIAKKVIVQFFGLIKDKFRKVIIKKLLLFIRSIFENTYIIEGFKLHLVELEKDRLDDLISLFTEFYGMIVQIQSQDTQVMKFKETITDQITNMFPLELRLVLFQPLLPNQHLYHYLGSQLEQHAPKKSQFQRLGQLMNIVPQEVSFEWIQFVRECLKRGNKPSEQLIKGVLQNMDLQGNLSTYAQLICEIAEHHGQILYSHLPLCIKVFEKHCSQPNDFTLALVARLITNLGEMVDPYLSNLILTSLSVESTFTVQFIEQITQHLTVSTLIQLIKQNYKKAAHIRNFSQLFKAVVTKGVGDSLNKPLLNFLGRTLNTFLENEQNPRQIVYLQGEIFLNIGLKMNEHQLRRFIIDLVRWGQAKSEMEEDLPFNYRKIAVLQIYCLMEENLQSLFNPFYGYIFESVLKDLQSVIKGFDSKIKTTASGELKRQREANTQFRGCLLELYVGLVLKAFDMLFKSDTDHQFLDSVKIQALGDPITEIILLSQFNQFKELTQKYLSPCLIGLHSCIVDDYQMKSVNYKMLVLLKRKNPKIHRFIFEVFEGLIDKLQDRFLILVSDLVPFLLEGVSSRQEGIAVTVRRIIGKIEELSGEEIANYAR